MKKGLGLSSHALGAGQDAHEFSRFDPAHGADTPREAQGAPLPFTHWPIILSEIGKVSPIFAKLDRGPWQLFLTILSRFGKNAYAWPTQKSLAASMRCSERSVRTFQRVLEKEGILLIRRVPQPEGWDRLYYAPGPVTRKALEALRERYPYPNQTAAPKPPPEQKPEPPPEQKPEPAEETHAEQAGTSDGLSPAVELPPEMVAGGPPEIIAAKQDQPIFMNSSSCEQPQAFNVPPPTPEEEQETSVTDEDRTIAREALTYRAQRKEPTAKIPSWWDLALITLVALRVAQQPGSREEKLETQRAAIDGAFLLSTQRTPTVRFIWEDQEHFLEHVARGRAKWQSDAERAKVCAKPKELPVTIPVEPVVSEETIAQELTRAEQTTDYTRDFLIMGLLPRMRGIMRPDLLARYEALRRLLV